MLALLSLQVVSAMEAVGVMELLTKHNARPQNPKVRRHTASMSMFHRFIGSTVAAVVPLLWWCGCVDFAWLVW
jgi:hypothetical protein